MRRMGNRRVLHPQKLRGTRWGGSGRGVKFAVLGGVLATVAFLVALALAFAGVGP